MRASLLFVAALVLVAGLSGATQSTVITVAVTDHHDRPVERASVILDFLGRHNLMKLGKREPKHWEVRTNQKGIARFPSIPQGTVRIQVIAATQQTFGERFDVDQEEKTIAVKLLPPQRQYSAHDPQ